MCFGHPSQKPPSQEILETDEFFGSLLNEDDLNDLRHVCRQRKIKVLLLSLKLYVQYVLDALTLSETANTENN